MFIIPILKITATHHSLYWSVKIVLRDWERIILDFGFRILENCFIPHFKIDRTLLPLLELSPKWFQEFWMD